MPRAEKNLRTVELSREEIQFVAARFKLLADATRLRILHTLQHGERTVSEVLAVTGTSQANISKHLGVLSRAKMIARRKEGNNAFYSIADPVIFELCELMCNRGRRN